MEASPDAPNLVRVQVLPDWTDPQHRRWQVIVRSQSGAQTMTFRSEEDARCAAFWLTGVGDFLDDLTWVKGSGFRTSIAA